MPISLIPTPQKLHTQPNFTGNIPDYGMFYLDNYPDSPADYNITFPQLISNFFTFQGYVTVGNSPQYDYQTIHDAVTDSKQKLLVLTDVTETQSTTFAGLLNIKCAPSINLNFTDCNIAASAGQDIFHLTTEGTVFINFTFTSDNILFDLSAITASPPGSIDGNFLIINNSAPSVSAKPLVTQLTSPYAFEMDKILYLTNGGINSYFDLGIGFINTFILVCNPLIDAVGLKIQDNGHITTLVLGTDCSSNTTICDVNDTSLSTVISEASATSGTPTVILVNSTCLSAIGVNRQIKFVTSATNGGECSRVSNGNNITPAPTGAYGSNFNDCLIAGLNISGLTAGVTIFSNCNFEPFVNINNSNAYLNINTCTFKQGLEISNSPGTELVGCNYGQAGGGYGLQIDAGAINTTVIGGRTNTAIIDNGVGTQIMPTPQTW